MVGRNAILGLWAWLIPPMTGARIMMAIISRNFVSENDVIIVKIDGQNQFPGEPYSLSPYNTGVVTTFRQFPYYFKELVRYIDSRYRTIADREHRAVSGLSMGGFMAFWLAAKYPDLVSVAGNFCGSTEFMAGPLAFPVRYEHAEMFDSFRGISVRMHNGSGDRLRFYRQDLNHGIANPGETIVILVNVDGKYLRTNAYTQHPGDQCAGNPYSHSR